MSDVFKEVGADRLLEMADVLDAAHKRQTRFSMARFFFDDGEVDDNQCGTPACALGHYAAATPERWGMHKSATDGRLYPRLKGHAWTATVWDHTTIDFGLTEQESSELFDGQGCGRATSPKEAATYIRNFVHRKLSCGVEG